MQEKSEDGRRIFSIEKAADTTLSKGIDRSSQKISENLISMLILGARREKDFMQSMPENVSNRIVKEHSPQKLWKDHQMQ